MQETERHYSLKYTNSFCYFPSRKEWGYVHTVNADGMSSTQFIKDIRTATMVNISVNEVPYKAPPGGWLLYNHRDIDPAAPKTMQGVILFSRMMRRTFRCGISPRNNYDICIDSPVNNMRERITVSGYLTILSALNLNTNVEEPSGNHSALSRNFFRYGTDIYWRSLKVGSLQPEGRTINVFLQEAVVQEFTDQVNMPKLLKTVGWEGNNYIIRDAREQEEELL